MIIVRLNFKDNIHDLSEIPKNFFQLLRAIENKFYLDLPKYYLLKYEDEDQDLVIMGSNEDYLQAKKIIQQAQFQYFTIHIFETNENEEHIIQKEIIEDSRQQRLNMLLKSFDQPALQESIFVKKNEELTINSILSTYQMILTKFENNFKSQTKEHQQLQKKNYIEKFDNLLSRFRKKLEEQFIYNLDQKIQQQEKIEKQNEPANKRDKFLLSDQQKPKNPYPEIKPPKFYSSEIAQKAEKLSSYIQGSYEDCLEFVENQNHLTFEQLVDLYYLNQKK